MWLLLGAASQLCGASIAGKHLFVDNLVIESTEHVRRVFHTPERHPRNPVLTGSEPWEHWSVEVDGRPVLYDDQRKRFRMWYGSNLVEKTAPQRIRYRVCYAESTDGVHWIKPTLGQVAWEGSRKNNLLRWGEAWMRRPNVILDDHDPDPSRRFKMTYVDVIGGKYAIAKGYSADGIDWRLNGDGTPWFREYHAANLLGWDPRINRYVIFPRIACSPCTIGRSTSGDFIRWSEPELVLAPEPSEPEKDFVGLAAFQQGDLYLGFLWVYHRVPNQKKIEYAAADIELASSRDGVHWQRVSPGKPFFAQGGPGSWDRKGLLLMPPVAHAGKLWLYYAGWNFQSGMDSLERSQKGWIENGERMQNAIGLAKLRLDGYVSLDAGRPPGTITTHLLEPRGNLYLNADVKGELRVELLDRDNRPIPGFSAADCEPIRSDSIRHRVKWRSGKARAQHPDEAKVRFLLREASLYSFVFE